MDTSLAVFLAFTVIYFGSLAMPFQVRTKMVGWSAQATTITGAVATFMLMLSRNVGILPASAVLALMTLVATLSAMSIVSCMERAQCQESLNVHALVFSTSFLSGAAAYIGFLASSGTGFPLWVSVVAAICFAPLYIMYAFPFLARHFETMFFRQE